MSHPLAHFGFENSTLALETRTNQLCLLSEIHRRWLYLDFIVKKKSNGLAEILRRRVYGV
ncbi:MAG: hypothetical protein C4576_30365 [Desulfobacteraceae bacterium]|nr:MAG: hypothetical protein C4576_30365 [Desulfobacteraceae bacterium]